MDDPFYGFAGIHVFMVLMGGVVVLSYWLPRFVSRREPAASGLLILIGFLAFWAVPGELSVPDPREEPFLWEILSEMTVIIALFGAGLRIDNLSSLTRWKPTIRLLLIAMPLTILAVALGGYWLAGMTVAGAVLLGAVLSPTDPVLAGDIQVGPPQEGKEHTVRFTLTTEAALNDGLAFPFVYLGLVIAASGIGAWAEWGPTWFLEDVVYRITVGALIGAACGWALGRALFTLPRKAPLAETASGIVAFAGILLTYGASELVEGYGFIAVAVAALVLRRIEHEHAFHRTLHDFSEALEHTLTAILLVMLGAVLPALFESLNWGHVAVAVLLVFVIRPLSGWLGLIGIDMTRRDRFVIAFYGVRGIGSIYYLAYAANNIEFVDEAGLWSLIGLTILLSTLVHGFTAGIAMDRLPKETTAE